MSDKKITDLQLRSNMNDDVNFPIDDGIQSYRVSGPQVKDYVYSNQQSPIDALNYSLTASVGASALTIALKDFAGNNGSTTSPIKIAFRSSTLTSGLPVVRSVVAALSTVISSGSTAGHSSGVAGELHIYALDNGGTVELAWSAAKIWDEGKLQSTTAEGGAGAADDGFTLYSTTARTNKAIRYIGRMISNQTVAGTWAAVPTQISSGFLNKPSGFVYWSGYTDPAASWQTTSATPVDGTNSGGNAITKRTGEGLAVTAAGSNAGGITFTPKSVDDVYEITASTVTNGQSNAQIQQVILTDGTVNIDARNIQEGNYTLHQACPSVTLNGFYKPGTTSPVTVKIQIGAPSGGTTNMFDPIGTVGSIVWAIKQIK